MEAKHSKLPWIAQKWGQESNPYTVCVTSDRLGVPCTVARGNPTGGGPYFPAIGEGGIPAEEAYANAEFIARACNSHADLLAACKAAHQHIKTYMGGDDVLVVLRSAISKAEATA